jgi:hypothetical protein
MTQLNIQKRPTKFYNFQRHFVSYFSGLILEDLLQSY